MAVLNCKIFILLIICNGCYGNKNNDGTLYLQDGILSLSDRSVFGSSLSSQNVSDACQEDLIKLVSGDPNLIKVLDSYGKPTPGTLVGNTAWLGHFDECMYITDFRYCLVDLSLNFTFSVNNTLMLPISWGVCVPVTCSEGDVQNGLEIFLDLLNVSFIGIKDVSRSAVHCTDKPNTNFTGGFIGTCVLISLLAVLSIIATAVDKHIPRKQKQRPSLPPIPHNSSSGSVADQRSSRGSTDPSALYATVNKRKTFQSEDVVSDNENKGLTDDPDSVYACIDDLRSDRVKEEAKGQGLNNEPHQSSEYGATGQDRRAFDRQASDREVHYSSGEPSETTALLAGTLRHMEEKKKAKKSLWIELLLCFSMSRNLPKILSTKQAAGGIPCLNGIRVISISWVILGHSFSMVHNAKLSENLYTVVNYLQDHFSMQVLLSTVVSVDSFFLLSGLLLSYLALKKMKENNGKIGWGWLYFHRYIRLTPTLALVILIWMFIIPNMNQGPVWYRFEGRFELCKAWWWTDLLYINNFVPPGLGQDCISWSWYLANDMQFFIISPLLLIPIYWYGIRGMVVLITTLMASFITIALLVYQNDISIAIPRNFDDVLSDQTEHIGYMFANDRNSIIYNKPYCRISPYLVGMALGYAIYEIGNKRIKLSPVFVAAGWAIASAMAIAVVYGQYNIVRGVSVPTQAASIMYITFFRFTWSLAVAWVIFACHYGYGGVVNDILSWNFWVPLSRLTYATYLIHPVIQNLYGFSLAVPMHWSVLTLSHLFAAFVLLAHCCALVIAVLVEFPLGNMEKMLQKFVQEKKAK